MNSIDKLPVPLGGSRVPESMGGSSCPPWQELPEQNQGETEGYGAACDAVMSLREQIGVLKKQLSGLAAPMKEYIYSSEPIDRAAIEAALAQVDAVAAAIGEAAKSAADATTADNCLSSSLKSEASSVLNSVRCDAAQQAADGRALCLVTADKSDVDARKRQEQDQQPTERKEFAKELYGDFNLQLGPITRKMFAAQTKLLALIKNIKKQKASSATQEEMVN